MDIYSQLQQEVGAAGGELDPKNVSFNSGFLGVYAQLWDCWVIRQFYFQFFKEAPHCSP